MADQCYMIEDALFTSEAWYPTTTMDLPAESGRFVDSMSQTYVRVLAESGTLSDAIDGRRTITLREAAALADDYAPGGAQQAALAERGRFRDRLRPTRSTLIADELQAADALDGPAATLLAERGVFADQVTPFRSPTATFSDARRFRDALSGVRADTLADSAQFTDGLSVRRGVTIAESAALADLFAPTAKAIIVLRDDGKVAEAYTGTATPRAMLADEGIVLERYMPQAPAAARDDHLASRNGEATGWAANTDTWGMSRYTEWPINSLAVIGGALYGASDQGLFELAGADDAGRAIDAFVRTGKEAWVEQTKGVNVLYAAATTDGRMAVTVDAAPHGIPGFFTYEFEERHALDVAPQRAKLARGVRSRYWQFTVGNQAGANFTIESVSVNAVAGQRRV